MYKFKTPRRAALPYLEKTPLDEQPDEEPMGIIQGQIPDSIQEWWISLAGNRIKIPYTYQYPVNGGGVRGGYKVDFVFMTVPLATMVEAKGNHWHTGELAKDDLKREADIEEAMRDWCKTPIVNLWIPDLMDPETVYQKLRKELL